MLVTVSDAEDGIRQTGHEILGNDAESLYG